METTLKQIQANTESKPYTRLLRMREVSHKAGISRSKIYELILEGEFPAPVKFGKMVSLWPESEVNDWIDALVKKSREVLP